MRAALALLIVLSFPLGNADARAKRSAAELLAFKRANPCPSTGQRRGPCPGYVIDHMDPLCNGGPDHRSNMQWQTRGESISKDREERRLCRRHRP